MTDLQLIFDADDTLWDDQGKLQEVERRLESSICKLSPNAERLFSEIFHETESHNIPLIGYGFHSYMFSLGEALGQCVDLDRHRHQLAEVLSDLINDYLHSAPRVFQGVVETLDLLRARGYSMHVLSRGYKGEQFEKFALSGLMNKFDRITAVIAKNRETYLSYIRELGIDPANCTMIGNSLRSDIHPALEAGLGAIHIPEPNSWSHDHAEERASPTRFRRISSFSQLETVLTGHNVV